MDPGLISALIQLKGNPYIPYDPFRVLYESDQPHMCVYKTGRQVAKTTSVIIQHILQAFKLDYFITLVVAPLDTQSARISNLFLRPIYKESKISKVFPTQLEQTYHVKFNNNSSIIFSYAYLDADRVRGIPADKIHIDEIQDINSEFVPVILEAASGSKYGFRIYTGTPKTHNNTLEFYWNKTSQAEWCIKCDACNHWNIPSIEHDLLKIIGEFREDISYERPGTVCAKCSNIIHPANGVWVHRVPERRWTAAGYHIPQPIISAHYADKVKWRDLLWKRDGGMSQANFYREVLGEPSDVASRLVTFNELMAVAELGDRTELSRIRSVLSSYPLRVLGIDWGGGGEGGNYTTISLVCATYDNVLHVPWAIELLTPHDHIAEAREIAKFVDMFQPHLVAHDYTGAGSLRETILIHTNSQLYGKMMPMRYVVGNEGVACRYVPPQPWHPKPCYHIDATRCLQFVCGAIKGKMIKFFNDDYISDDSPGLLRHFLSLIEDVHVGRGTESYRIVCEPGYKSEFAHATMLGCVAIWQKTQRWPNFQLTGMSNAND